MGKRIAKDNIKKNKFQMVFISFAIVFLVLSSLGIYFIVNSIQSAILSLDIKNTEEVSFHDNKLASNVINDIWDDMDGIVNDVKNNEALTSTQDIINQVILDKYFIQYCIDIALVSTDKEFYGLDETQPIFDESVYYILELGYEKHAYRTDNKATLTKSFGENKIFLMKKISKFTKFGVEFKYFICTLSVNAIQNQLTTGSYKGNASSFIIDSNGEYVDDRSLTEGSSYFQYLSEYDIEGYTDINSLIKEIRSTDDYLSIIISKGDSKEIVVLSPIENTNWISVSTLPKDVYDEQTNKIMNWTWLSIGLVGIILIIFLLFLYIFFRKNLAQKVEKEYTAQIEAKNAQLEQKQLELETALEEAKQASQAKTSFLFNMSHDIRTPMNAIMGYASLAKKNISDKEKVQVNLEKVQASSERLLYILNDILDMSRIESGKWNIDEKPTNIISSLGVDIDALSLSAKNNQIEFKTNVNIKHSTVVLDPQHVSRVTTNIVTNAIKYTPAGGKVTLSVDEVASEKEGYAKYIFKCEDTGIGIDKEYIPHIFESFSREANTTKSGIQGTGLGLAITKTLVDLMGGTIELDSEKGKGTKFTVTLEFMIAEETNEQVDSQPTTENSEDKDEPIDTIERLKGKKILVVDDNDINREILIEVLEDEDMITGEANDGDVAVEMLRNAAAGEYDLVLMDIQMPKMNGYDATIAIRALENSSVVNIPIIAFSANAFEEDIKKSIQSGMNAHISKPLNIAELNQTLLKFIK